MFRIRRIYDDILPVNQMAIREVNKIFTDQFADAPPKDIGYLAEHLRNPFKQGFRLILYVAEKGRRHVQGFATVMHEPVIDFCYLDFVATDKKVRGRGVGAALYEFVRDEAVGFGAKGLFFECLPDEESRCADPAIRQQNAARLKFYERYGARPIVGTDYELPVPGGDSDCTPHLMFDDLDANLPLRPALAREVVRAILERKYVDLCTPEYVGRVVESLTDDPVRLRDFRYVTTPSKHKPAGTCATELIPITVNDKHDIHHIRERGYVESPVRIKAIKDELDRSELFQSTKVKSHPLKHITAVHDPDFVEYLKRACENTPAGKSVYPYVFPIRNAARPPKELSVRAGYYCIDTFTPINANAYPAAKRAVDCALTAADEVLGGRRIAYALVRPPGHHAERRSFGGFCYFNNNAIAANYLSQYGKVAIIDVDYHHGNGQQDIFYDRDDVLTVSLHGDPDFAYPYFTGFADERGVGSGEGFNLNFPLPEVQDGAQYRETLERAVQAARDFQPAFLVIALGLDPAKGDPTGTWSLKAKDFLENGRLLGSLHLPTLVIQEGGYLTRTLGVNARNFFSGLKQANLSGDPS